MKSMTGFGVFRTQNNDLTVEVSFRAVNGRYLETRFHLPRIYFPFESDLKKKLSTVALRGTIDIYILRKLKTNTSGTKIRVNTKLALEYLKAFKKLSSDLRLSESIRLDQISK